MLLGQLVQASEAFIAIFPYWAGECTQLVSRALAPRDSSLRVAETRQDLRLYRLFRID